MFENGRKKIKKQKTRRGEKGKEERVSDREKEDGNWRETRENVGKEKILPMVGGACQQGEKIQWVRTSEKSKAPIGKEGLAEEGGRGIL